MHHRDLSHAGQRRVGAHVVTGSVAVARGEDLENEQWVDDDLVTAHVVIGGYDEVRHADIATGIQRRDDRPLCQNLQRQ